MKSRGIVTGLPGEISDVAESMRGDESRSDIQRNRLELRRGDPSRAQSSCQSRRNDKNPYGQWARHETPRGRSRYARPPTRRLIGIMERASSFEFDLTETKQGTSACFVA